MVSVRSLCRALVPGALAVLLATPAASAVPQGDALKVVQVIRFGGGMFEGMMGGMIRRSGMPEEMEETIVVNALATKKRSDQGRDRSQIIDLDTEQVIELDHKKKRAKVLPFAVMRERMAKASEAMASLQQGQDGGAEERDASDVQVTLEAGVVSAGAVQHGPFAAEEFRQTLAFRSRDGAGNDLGAFVAYNVMHVTDAFDRGPLDTFDRAYAMKMSEMMAGTGGMGAAMAALLGDPRIREALVEAGKGFEEIGGRAAVYTRMAMVSVPPGMVFDPEKAFLKPEKKGGGLGGMLGGMMGGGSRDQQQRAEQSTSLTTEMDVRSAEWITLAGDPFAVPQGYKVEVERE